MTRWIGERKSVISGLGRSEVGRRLERTPIDLTMEACAAAIQDAGLEASDIDGLTLYAGGPTAGDIRDAFDLHLSWYGTNTTGPAQLGALISATMAIATGLCRHVLVYHTVAMSEAPGSGRGRIGGDLQWLLPFRALSPAHWNAFRATRYMHETGLTREQLAQIPLNGRRNAERNPQAIYRTPMTLDDYLGARMITTPLSLLDCDVPVDGCTAFVVSDADYGPDARTTSVQVHAVGAALASRPRWDQWDTTTDVIDEVAAQLWARSDVAAADVDVAQLYDGFSFMPLLWIEALGFCARGEAGSFVEGGERIGLGGDLPLNTDGGQLSAGRLHGFGLLYEACLQLRHQASTRQVPGAEVAVVTNGSPPVAGAMVLTRGR